MLVERLSINAPLDDPTILKFSEAYRTTITRNLLGLLESSIVYYEPILTVTKHICRIIIPTSLRLTIFNLMHATPIFGHMGEYKTLYRIRLRCFGLGYVLKFLIRSRRIPIVCSCIVRDDKDRN